MNMKFQPTPRRRREIVTSWLVLRSHVVPKSAPVYPKTENKPSKVSAETIILIIYLKA